MTARLKLDDTKVSWRDIDGEIVAVDLANSEYISLNRSGAMLWRVLAEGTDRSALIAVLADAYDLEEDDAVRDVDTFLAAVQARGIIRV